jgi:hypothetical protein
MPWTDQNQADAEKQADGFDTEFNEKWEAWRNAVQSGKPNSGQAAVEDVVRRWQQSLNVLKAQSDSVMSNDTVMDELGQLAVQLAEQKATLRKLRSEAGTRADQADSLNPKIRSSPYTNLLGLDRVFRDSTRHGILIASVVFGLLALGSLGFLVYSVVNQGALVVPGQYIQGGSGRTPKR